MARQKLLLPSRAYTSTLSPENAVVLAQAPDIPDFDFGQNKTIIVPDRSRRETSASCRLWLDFGQNKTIIVPDRSRRETSASCRLRLGYHARVDCALPADAES